MRAIIFIAGAALALTACGNNGQAGNTTNVEQGLTAEDIVSNDVTAIDAVTGDAANMAADMDVSFTNEMDTGMDNTAAPAQSTPRPTPKPEAKTGASATNETAVNEAANAVEE